MKIIYQATTLRLIKAVTLNARVTLLCISQVDFRLVGMRSHFFEIVRPLSHLHNTVQVHQTSKSNFRRARKKKKKSSNLTTDSRLKKFFMSV